MNCYFAVLLRLQILCALLHGISIALSQSTELKSDLINFKLKRKLDDFETNFEMLIVGGYRPNQHTLTKYVVSIRSATSSVYIGDNHYCSGVIIAPEFILTAAHCVTDVKKISTLPRRIQIVGGTPNRLDWSNFTLELQVEAIMVHAKFKTTRYHDIALLRLATPIPTDNDHIKIIPIAERLPLMGTTCITLGWGRIFLNGPFAAEAVYLELSIMKPAVCLDKYPNIFGPGMICAHDMLHSEKRPCHGDSGGPLICNNMLVGIISWSNQYKSDYPTIFTDVVYHTQWITTLLGVC